MNGLIVLDPVGIPQKSSRKAMERVETLDSKRIGFKETDQMAKRTALAKAVDDISEAVPHLIRLPQKKAWIDYDEEADVLYISLKRPQKATDTKLLGDKGILLRYRDKDLVGVTVLDASKSRKQKKGRN
jgi:uncharacterized protein YuzE